MTNVENYFKGLADINRLRIINLLFTGELCGCDIQYVLEASQSNVSRHLTYLKRSGLVADRRAGFRIYYRLVEGDKREHKALVSYLKVALKDKLFLADAKKLKQAIKCGACSVSELKPGVVSPRSGLQTHGRS
jgi:ArsR family transcriptional regulator, arsenate/arsenite/antimonite-responsive transcriptional repressor